ncbi:GAF and ANTAR domain-containing protein [Arthrobacter sp. Ld5]|uniref:GAF and ANTAR domain-containing protein n=1 Tax=Arthrobacter sp. Ld5 TaxID=649152 RepID=UPI003EBF9467
MDNPISVLKDITHSLHELMLSEDSVEVFLQELAYLAARAFSATVRVECGITYQPAHGGVLTVASSSAAVVLMDEAQYATDDGPCLHALRTGESTDVQDVTTDLRWPVFFGAVQHVGFRSVLGTRLWVGELGAAALNLYANGPGFFDQPMQDAVNDFAQQAGSTLQVMLRGQGAKQHALNLQAAMASRTIIDLAVGIIMGQNRCSQVAAFGILKDASNHRNLKLRVVAEQLIGTVTDEPASTHFTDGAGPTASSSRPGT